MAIIVRRELDDARFCIVNGFMLIYSLFFKAYDVLNKYDTQGNTTEWRFFRYALERFFQKHIEMRTKYNREDETKTHYIWQIKSVFDYIRRDELIAVDGSVPPICDPLPDAAVFQDARCRAPTRHGLRTCYIHTYRTAHASSLLHEDNVLTATRITLRSRSDQREHTFISLQTTPNYGNADHIAYRKQSTDVYRDAR